MIPTAPSDETIEKHFLQESVEQQESINARDLKELKHYYGSWQELRAIIDKLEANENEAAWERSQNQSQ